LNFYAIIGPDVICAFASQAHDTSYDQRRRAAASTAAATRRKIPGDSQIERARGVGVGSKGLRIATLVRSLQTNVRKASQCVIGAFLFTGFAPQSALPLTVFKA
jgi:hypothetical protein